MPLGLLYCDAKLPAAYTIARQELHPFKCSAFEDSQHCLHCTLPDSRQKLTSTQGKGICCQEHLCKMQPVMKNTFKHAKRLFGWVENGS